MPETLGINRYNNVEEEKLSSQENNKGFNDCAALFLEGANAPPQSRTVALLLERLLRDGGLEWFSPAVCASRTKP